MYLIFYKKYNTTASKWAQNLKIVNVIWNLEMKTGIVCLGLCAFLCVGNCLCVCERENVWVCLGVCVWGWVCGAWLYER